MDEIKYKEIRNIYYYCQNSECCQYHRIHRIVPLNPFLEFTAQCSYCLDGFHIYYSEDSAKEAIKKELT
jgi:hypothetical protein